MTPGVGDLLEGPVRDRLIMFLFAFDTFGQLLILSLGNVGPFLPGTVRSRIMDRTGPFKTTHTGPRLPLEEIYEPYFLHAFAKGCPCVDI